MYLYFYSSRLYWAPFKYSILIYFSGSGGPKLIVDGNLTIFPVSRADAGLYTCTAKNDYGGDASWTRLTVLRMCKFS